MFQDTIYKHQFKLSATSDYLFNFITIVRAGESERERGTEDNFHF